MTRPTLFCAALAAGLLGMPMVPASAAPPREGRYVVVLEQGVSATRLAKDHSRRFDADTQHVYGSALAGYSAKIPTARLNKLRLAAGVARVVADRRVRSAGRSGSQALPTGINRIDADLSGAGDGSGTLNSPAVAVLDTGSGPHPELNIAGGKACVGRDHADGNGHGTHAAGTIAAKDDAAGVVGVAPGAPIYSVRVLDSSGGGDLSDLLCGVDWLVANATTLGIKVASMSLVTPGSDDGNCGNTNGDPLHQAICAATARGVTVIASAGNDATDFAASVPAAYDEVLTVSAISDTNGTAGGGGVMPKGCSADVDDSAADFSNFAAPGTSDTLHTLAAPGKCINSTWRGGGYRLSSGTSMAAPHAAGAAALCIATGGCAGLSPFQVIAKLRSDAAARPASYGFVEDPFRVSGGSRYYGHLLYAGGYGPTTSGPNTGPGGGSGTGGTPPKPGRGKKK